MYEVLVSEPVAAQIDSLPAHARSKVDKIEQVLTLTPWNGRPVAAWNPEGPFRSWNFIAGDGYGTLYFTIVEHDRQVVLEDLVWVG